MTGSADGFPDVPERLVYSVDEAADLLGIGRTFMYHLVANGEIESFKIGNRRKIPRDAISQYIDRLRAEQLSGEEPRAAISRTSCPPSERTRGRTRH